MNSPPPPRDGDELASGASESPHADATVNYSHTAEAKVAAAGSAPKHETRGGFSFETRAAHLQVRCPNCRLPIDVPADSSLTDLICSSCGSHFSLVDHNQATGLARSITTMGRFELVDRLGVGSFGTVWKARDKELDRTVALKIPRQGGMSPGDIEKFFREARAAAQLRHPNIVSVHEVGREGDCVFIVSDFVRGVTLGDWLTGQQLTSREAAELCATIADALHHAHEHGVVHRDLKPANVIIDGEGAPHIMDFGLARRDAGEVTVTVDGQVLGTPAYMSPEQALGDAHKADRRSDVYSLGVILFQLLTGELPFRGNSRMLLHQVIHDEPPSPRKLNANVPRDLETIVLKCLEKKPERRYATSLEVEDELHRFLRGDAILARPISRSERAWRWANRNRAVAGLSAAVAAALVVGTGVSLWWAMAAHRAETLAEARLVNETRARRHATAISDLLQSALAAANPNSARADYTVRQLLDEVGGRLGDELRDQPEAEAAIRSTIGNAYCQLDAWKQAAPHLNRALREQLHGPESIEVARSLYDEAWNFMAQNDLKPAESHVRRALEIHRKLGIRDDETMQLLSVLQMTLHRGGKIEAAVEAGSQALEIAAELPEPTPEVANLMHRQGGILWDLGRAEEGVELARQSIPLHRRLHGDNHPETAWALYTLARISGPKECENLLREAMAIFSSQFSDFNSGWRLTVEMLARMLRDHDPQALDELRKEIVARVQRQRERNPDDVTSLVNAARGLQWLGATDESLAVCRHIESSGLVRELARNVEDESTFAEWMWAVAETGDRQLLATVFQTAIKRLELKQQEQPPGAIVAAMQTLQLPWHYATKESFEEQVGPRLLPALDAIAADPETAVSGDLLFQLATSLARSSVTSDERVDLERMTRLLSVLCDRLDPADDEIRNSIAWELVASEVVEPEVARLAVRLSKRTVDINAKKGYSLNTLGVALYRDGQYEEAIDVLRRGRELSREGAVGADGYFLAMSYAKTGDLERAEKWFHAGDAWTRTFSRDSSELRQFRAETAKILDIPLDDLAPLTGVNNAGVAVFQKVRDADPDANWVYQVLGERQAMAGDWHDAAETLAIAVQRPRDPDKLGEILHLLALAQLHTGDLDGYRNSCAAILAAPADDPHEKDRIVWTWCLGPNASDDLSSVVKLAEQFADQNSQRPVPPFYLGSILFRDGQFDRAQSLLEKSIVANPGDNGIVEEARLLLAMTMWRQGREDDARRMWREVIPQIDAAIDSTDGSWRRQATLEILRREAAALISEPEVADAESTGNAAP